MSTSFSEIEKRFMARLPDLDRLGPDQVVGLTLKQLSVLACLPIGSVSWAMARSELKPAVENSNAFFVRDLRAFVAKHRGDAIRRLSASYGDRTDRAAHDEAAERTRQALKTLLAQSEG